MFLEVRSSVTHTSQKEWLANVITSSQIYSYDLCWLSACNCQSCNIVGSCDVVTAGLKILFGKIFKFCIWTGTIYRTYCSSIFNEVNLLRVFLSFYYNKRTWGGSTPPNLWCKKRKSFNGSRDSCIIYRPENKYRILVISEEAGMQ